MYTHLRNDVEEDDNNDDGDDDAFLPSVGTHFNRVTLSRAGKLDANL